jgi:hypothetical protein
VDVAPEKHDKANADAACPPRPPLDESHFALIRQAVISRRKVKNAARTALSSSMVTLVIGVPALLCAIFWPSWRSLLIGAGICFVGVVEFLGHRRMRRAEPSAAGLLGRNQLTFLALITVYCVAQMLTFSTEQAKAAALSPEVRSHLAALPNMAQAVDEEIERWAPLLIYGFYSLIIALSVCFQGGMALYYFTRNRHVESFNRGTPEWIRRLFIEIGA